jgi:sulfite exporter TauE/SafE
MKNKKRFWVYAIALVFLVPLILPLPGVVIAHLVYSSEKASEATSAIYTLSFGVGAIGWCFFAGFGVIKLLGKNKITSFILYPVLICSIFLCLAAAASLLGRDGGKSFKDGFSGYWIPVSIGCILGFADSESDRKKKVLEKRMDWMK